MFQKKSWLFLLIVFGLMILAFFLPFERVSAQRGDIAAESSLSGWELVSSSGVMPRVMPPRDVARPRSFVGPSSTKVEIPISCA